MSMKNAVEGTSRLGASAALIGVLVACFFAGQFVAARLRPSQRSAVDVRQEALPRVGRQYVVVYIGSSRCGPSNQKETLEAVRVAISAIRARGAVEGRGVVSIGVAREQSAMAGLDHLRKVESFDEVASGQGDFNQSSGRFISNDHRGVGATPQVVVLERVIQPSVGTLDPSAVSERVLVRKVGAHEINRWVQRGVPLPKRRTLQGL